jgi:exopolysaccharide biosynthesis protein
VSLLGGRGWRRVGLPGVRLKKAGPVAILAIDRTNSKVSLDTTKVGGKFSLKNQARRQRADIALNGDLFNFDTGKPSGLHRRHGRTLRGTSRKPWIGMFAFGRGRAGILSGKTRLPSWARNVVSGRPIILRNNRVVRRYSPGDAPRLNQENGRSAVGLSRSGRVLFLAASSASTTRQMAQLLKKSGADDALALDGSGSAQMYLKGRMVKPGDGRKIGNAILVKTD